MSHTPTSPPPGSVPGSMSPGDMESLMDPATAGSAQDPSKMLSQLGGAGANPGSSTSSKTPRPVTTIPQEGKYLAQDLGQGILSLLPDFMQEILGVKETDTPEQKAKKQQMLQNYQKLNAEDQAYVQQKMQREQAEKQQREEEDHMRRQQEAADQGGDIGMPTGKVTGEAAAGASNKQRTTQKLQSDRKKMTSAG